MNEFLMRQLVAERQQRLRQEAEGIHNARLARSARRAGRRAARASRRADAAAHASSNVVELYPPTYGDAA